MGIHCSVLLTFNYKNPALLLTTNPPFQRLQPSIFFSIFRVVQPSPLPVSEHHPQKKPGTLQQPLLSPLPEPLATIVSAELLTFMHIWEKAEKARQTCSGPRGKGTEEA